MPAATGSHHSASLDQVLHSLQHTDPKSAKQNLQKAKLALLHQNALIPNEKTPVHTLTTARSILEAGALLSIHARDAESFIKYYSQLQPFYDFPSLQSSPSQNKSKITGLYLLLLLSQGDYAGFHTLLESLIVAEGANGGKSVEEDPFIRYPIELERSLMEGSYDLVWRKTKGRDVPGEEFALFSEVFSFPSGALRYAHKLADSGTNHSFGDCLLCYALLSFPLYRVRKKPTVSGLRRRRHRVCR